MYRSVHRTQNLTIPHSSCRLWSVSLNVNSRSVLKYSTMSFIFDFVKSRIRVLCKNIHKIVWKYLVKILIPWLDQYLFPLSKCRAFLNQVKIWKKKAFNAVLTTLLVWGRRSCGIRLARILGRGHGLSSVPRLGSKPGLCRNCLVGWILSSRVWRLLLRILCSYYCGCGCCHHRCEGR